MERLLDSTDKEVLFEVYQYINNHQIRLENRDARWQEFNISRNRARDRITEITQDSRFIDISEEFEETIRIENRWIEEYNHFRHNWSW
ncbi:MAG: hypothetical protein FWC79_03830 [Oscillospiraceae bacterium]|nr:hypothetical protein [Oscillospiraceae bacterium]